MNKQKNRNHGLFTLKYDRSIIHCERKTTQLGTNATAKDNKQKNDVENQDTKPKSAIF